MHGCTSTRERERERERLLFQCTGEVVDYLHEWLKASHEQQRHHEGEGEEEVNSLRKQVQLQAEELAELRQKVNHSREVEEQLLQTHSQMVGQLVPLDYLCNPSLLQGCHEETLPAADGREQDIEDIG